LANSPLEAAAEITVNDPRKLLRFAENIDTRAKHATRTGYLAVAKAVTG
jgi:hypothetical protein